MDLSYTQKKEMLASLENKLASLSKELEHSERSKVNSLKRTISSSIDDESNWENFQVHFDQKNDNFFQKLKELDGKLNESYLLFCSHVRMGKSNKEIAEFFNIQYQTTLLIFKDNKEVYRSIGETTKELIYDALKSSI